MLFSLHESWRASGCNVMFQSARSDKPAGWCFVWSKYPETGTLGRDLQPANIESSTAMHSQNNFPLQCMKSLQCVRLWMKLEQDVTRPLLQQEPPQRRLCVDTGVGKPP